MLITRDISMKNFIEFEVSIFQCVHFTFEGFKVKLHMYFCRITCTFLFSITKMLDCWILASLFSSDFLKDCVVGLFFFFCGFKPVLMVWTYLNYEQCPKIIYFFLPKKASGLFYMQVYFAIYLSFLHNRLSLSFVSYIKKMQLLKIKLAKLFLHLEEGKW